MARIRIFFMGVVLFLALILVTGCQLNDVDTPEAKASFQAKAQKHVESRYPQFSFQLEEPTYKKCPLLHANCYSHWRAKGVLQDDSGIQFEVWEGPKEMEDNLGVVWWSEQFAKDQAAVQALVDQVLMETEEKLSASVSWEDWKYKGGDRFREKPFVLDYKEAMQKDPQWLRVAVNIRWIKKVDEAGLEEVANSLWHLKQTLEQKGYSSLYIKISFSPSEEEYVSHSLKVFTYKWKDLSDAQKDVQTSLKAYSS